MRVPRCIVQPLTRWVKRRYTNYMIPSQTIRENADDPKSPILIKRHNMLSLPGFKVRAHEIVRSDHVRDLHDHPWLNITLVLEGGYYEVTPTGIKMRHEGDLVFRRAKARHQIFLPIEPLYLGHGNVGEQDVPCLTLFIHGRATRRWGFWAADGSFTPAQRQS